MSLNLVQAPQNGHQLNANALQNGLEDLLAFKPEDAYRRDRASREWEVLNLSSLFLRAIFYVFEYFSGGVAQHDNAAFDALYQQKIVEPLQTLTDASGQGSGPEALRERADMLRTLMKVHAKIDVSRWGDNLRSNRNYQSFYAAILVVQGAILEEMEASPEVLRRNPEERALKRWMDSNLEQRRFAAFCNSDLPYRWRELPGGAVVLTNCNSWETSIKLKGHKLTWGQWATFGIKTFFCKLFTGSVYAHSELVLGNGYTFDLGLSRVDGHWWEGEVTIKNHCERRPDSLCYNGVFVPNRDAMVGAYNTMVRESGDRNLEEVGSFEELWAKIEQEARAHRQEIRSSAVDIVRVILPFSRPAGYDATQAWEPGVKQYGCSALITALMGKYGIDIGVQFNKQAQNVSPADFSRSNFYQPYFVANSN